MLYIMIHVARWLYQSNECPASVCAEFPCTHLFCATPHFRFSFPCICKSKTDLRPLPDPYFTLRLNDESNWIVWQLLGYECLACRIVSHAVWFQRVR